MAAEQLEIETKFDVAPSFVVPDLTGVGGVASVDAPVEHRLEARYFDTADFRLAQARITLRRRTGGTDDGWHVKVPAPGNARLELHRPLGRAAWRPPKAVLAPVAGILRGTVPAPVAQLHTRRVVTVLRDAEGRALAEVADDMVTATRLGGPDGTAEVRGWREVEVELLDGPPTLLEPVGERLVAAGAERTDRASKLTRALGLEPAPTDVARVRAKKKRKKRAGPQAGDVVLAALQERVIALGHADVAVRTGQDDAVHRMRVACRRLRGTLAAFGPVLAREATDPLRAELSWLAGRLSEARDDEVALEYLRGAVTELPAELVLGPVVARLQTAQVTAGEDRRASALDLVAEPRHLRLLDALHALLVDPPLTPAARRPAGPVLEVVLHREVRRLRRSVAAADACSGEERTEALHKVRRTARRTRYTATAIAPAVGSPAEVVAAVAKKAQRLLGELQDLVVVGERCRQLALNAHAAGEPGFTYGLLLGRAEARGQVAERAFAARWPDLAERLPGSMVELNARPR